jgi:hydrogenase/urease accessory protein HupE
MSVPGRVNVAHTVWRAALLSSLLALFWSAATAHELRPAIADLTATDDRLSLSVTLNAEALLAGIDLEVHADSTESPEAADYDALRAQPPEALSDQLRAIWPEIARNLTIRADGTDLAAELEGVEVPPVGDVAIARDSTLTIAAALPPGTRTVEVGWTSDYGPLVIRQFGVDAPYSGYLTGGALSDPIPLQGGGADPWPRVFADYVGLGFEHILPKGLDHILFVLGLFFLSLHIRPLVWQISAFTVAHTITLALGILGHVTVPASVVEPLIAASIVYVGVENVLSRGLTPWRPVVVFLFGLLHGLGFASVLAELGLPPGQYVPSLIGFNVGVEIGQLTVVALAYLAVGYWFGDKPWYRSRIANPASIAIAAVGAWWVIERTVL